MNVTPGTAPIVRTKPVPTLGISAAEAAESLKRFEEALTPNPIAKVIEQMEATDKPEPKKPFIRKPHLTDRPLKDNEDLQKLRDELQQKQRNQYRARNARLKVKVR